MATPVNDRDVLLLGSSQRSVNPLNSALLLSTDAPAFHVTTDGVATPATITITAHLIGIIGKASFSAAGATVVNNNDNTATVSFSTVSGPSATITGTVVSNGQTFTTSITISKVVDGTAGGAGPAGQGTAIAYLYQWSTTTPSAPTGTSTFDWTTGANTSYTNSDAWRAVAPANPNIPGIMLWVAAKPITAAGGTATTTVSYATGAVITAYTQNGKDGAAGVKSAVARAYLWSIGAPPTATGSATYTWASGTYDNVPTGGWSITKPAAPAKGYTLYEASVNLLDAAGSATSAINWTNATIVGVGYVGVDGSGSTGASAAIAYTLIDGFTLNSTPSSFVANGKALPTTGTWGETRAWTSQPSVPAAGQAVFQSNGIYDPTTDKTTWGLPYLSALRVGSLSAITANLGAITAGSINLGNNTFIVDNNGNVTCYSITILDPATGEVVLQAGSKLNAKYAPLGTLNSDIVIGGRNYYRKTSTMGALSGATTTFTRPVPDGFDLYGSSAGSGGGSVRIANVVPRNGTYTVSFDLAVSNFNGFDVWVDVCDSVGQKISPTTTPQRFSLTFTVTNWSADTYNFIDFSGLSQQWHYFRNFKIEEGNKATSYTPAPEDVDAAVAAAQAAADTANTAIANITSDNVLSKGEKSEVIRQWNTIYAERSGAGGIASKADELGVSRVDYDAAYTELSNYLVSVNYADTTADTPIDGPTFRLKFTNYYSEKQKIINVMTAKAATLANDDGSIRTPIGANFSDSSNTATGSLKIRLPQSWTNTMMKFFVDLYEYVDNNVCTLEIGGYNYSGDGGAWYAVTARVVGGSNVEYPVFFGHDGTKCCVWIGYPTGQWSYLKARVRDVMLGHSNYSKTQWESGWQISFDSGARNETVKVLDTLPGADWAKIPGKNGRPADNATVGAPPGTIVGSSLAENVDSWAQQGYNAWNALPAVNTAIAGKLAKSGTDTINGQITLQATYALLVGTANDGIYYGSSGLYGRKGGNTTFAIQSDGTATFAGQLMAAFGSFGAVSIASGGYLSAGQTGYNIGTGFWLGWSGGVPKFSIGSSTSNLVWDGTSLILTNPTTTSNFSATITNTVGQYNWSVSRNTNGAFAGSYTANPSNGSGTYTYNWSVSSSGIAKGWIAGNTANQQVTLNVYGNGMLAGDSADFYLTCIVTDTGRNISKTVTQLVTVTFT